MGYNGWSNRETWLVRVRYVDDVGRWMASNGQTVDAPDARDLIRHVVEEGETLSQLPSGLLSDFLEAAWERVDWDQIAYALNEAAALEA